MGSSSYWQRLTQRRISRRRALAAAGAAGLGVAGVALGGCGGGAQESASEIPTAMPAGTPKPGGMVKLGVPADPGSLDPHRNVASSYISSLIHNPLHTVDMSTGGVDSSGC